jgi:hypothetical protein
MNANFFLLRKHIDRSRIGRCYNLKSKKSTSFDIFKKCIPIMYINHIENMWSINLFQNEYIAIALLVLYS